MGDVIIFQLRTKPTRRQAQQWLTANVAAFPVMMADIGPDIFHGWRFVLGTDGIMYFANCIEAGISEWEWLDAKNKTATQ